jgi:peptidoglycan/xylan/chitin deacetylase (PgdA/CDA1 family)
MTGVDILLYHSIANGPPPLAISPVTFRMHLQALAAHGFRGVSLREYMAHRVSAATSGERIVVLTFDDGYADFTEAAFPEIESRGWGCTLFVSPACIDGTVDSRSTGMLSRPLLGWADLDRLARRGVEIGAHGLTHADLARAMPNVIREEVVESRSVIEARLGTRISSFAPPFGRSSSAVRGQIRQHYRCAVGTTLGRATVASDPFDLPRIEMWYFRGRARWERYLKCGPTAYFHARRLLRAVRQGIRRSNSHSGL